MSRGRGKGRGRGRSFGNLEMLGIAPGEPAPPPILQPPPYFPALDRKPLELKESDLEEYLLTVKQDLRQFMKQSPFYLKAGSDKKEIQRYSDKYQSVKDSEIDNVLGWKPDWNYFPDELRIGKKKTKKKKGLKFSPVVKERAERKRPHDGEDSGGELTAPKTKRQKKVVFGEETTTGMSTKLEKQDMATEDEQTEGEDDDPGVVAEEEDYDEELEEEGTDYNMTYFDNGEDYIGGEDDNLEEHEGPYY